MEDPMRRTVVMVVSLLALCACEDDKAQTGTTDTGGADSATGDIDQGDELETSEPDTADATAVDEDTSDTAPDIDETSDTCTCSEVTTCCDGCNPLDVGDECDDGLTCTVETTCQPDGTCGGSTGTVCDQDMTEPQCQVVSCDEVAGCSPVEAAREGFTCDDGDSATFSDRCVAGVCQGNTCPCETTDTCCDGCQPQNEGQACDDGDASTDPDACSGGMCVGEPLPRWVQASAGLISTCAIKNTGEMQCWGDNTYGQAPPAAGGLYSAISMSHKFGCGILKGTDTLSCWGQVPFTTNAAIIESLHCSNKGCCILTPAASPGSLNLSCRGETTGSVPNEEFVEVYEDETYTCGLTPNGSVRCWGSYSPSPAHPTTRPFTHVAASDQGGCAINDVGDVECWGQFYQDGLTGSFEQIAMTDLAYCVLNGTGGIRCQPRSNIGTPPPFLAQTPSFLKFESISLNNNHACGITLDGELKCWGDNTYGQIPP